MASDSELLQRFVTSRSDEAFTELVKRHLDLVYSAALRQVNGDTHLARDVAQSVFIDLARKAPSLVNRPVLAGWLYTSARYAAAKVVRASTRRERHEIEAHTMATLLHDSSEAPDWHEVEPLLDAAMHELKESDREAIILRYFQNQPHAEVGKQLGISENTARMRVERALEKLRSRLIKRGISTSAAALSVVVSSNAMQAAPAGLITTISSSAMSAAVLGSATFNTFALMSMTKLQAGVIAAIVISAATGLLVQQRSNQSLRQENQTLRQEVGQLRLEQASRLNRTSLPRTIGAFRAPIPRLTSATSAEGPLEGSSIYSKINGEPRKLKNEQVAPYLQTHGRTASTLLAAYRTTGDPQFLEEAMKNFANDPLVAFEALFRKGASPEDKLAWLETFKTADPQNSLPNYLSALEHMKGGRMDQAIQELMNASGKATYNDYTNYRLQEDQEVWLAAGHSVAEAKTFSATQLLLPQLHHVKDLGIKLGELAASYRQAGDAASAQTALDMAAQLGQRYQNTPGETEISWLVGVAVERAALSKMDPNTPYGPNGETVQQRLDHLTLERNEIRELNAKLETLLSNLTDQDWISYQDRWRIFGEKAAIQWIINKYGQN